MNSPPAIGRFIINLKLTAGSGNSGPFLFVNKCLLKTSSILKVVLSLKQSFLF